MKKQRLFDTKTIKFAASLKRICAEANSVSVAIAFDPKGRYQVMEAVMSRYMFCKIIHSHKNLFDKWLTYADIGALVYFPDVQKPMDHATVLHGLKTVDNMCATDIHFKRSFEAAERAFIRYINNSTDKRILHDRNVRHWNRLYRMTDQRLKFNFVNL